MRKILLIAVAVLGLRAAILDRIAVSVGKQVITESDILKDLRVAAFIDRRPVDLSGDQKRKSADRLVDQFLILEEAGLTRVALAAPEDAAQMLDQVKTQYGDDYQAALQRSGISEDDVKAQLLNGLRALRFTDLRFRPEIQLSTDELREFYDSMVAKAKNPAEVPSFETSRDQVEKLMTDQRTAQALDRWLGIRRTETQIVYREQVFK